jgi:chemotaxis protein MotB
MKPELNIEPQIIYRKAKGHGAAHHGGAWKIAYADFVTAMMAFFMLMWILGATDEDQRKGIADYFTPTIIQMKNSGGSNGIMGGRSLQSEEGVAPQATMTGPRPSPVTGGGGGGPSDAETASKSEFVNPGNSRSADEARFRMVERIIAARLAGDPTLVGLKGQIRLVRVHDGLRIDMVERADFSMFENASSVFSPQALAMVRTVANAIKDTPNRLTVRGHTDSRRFASGSANNWTLSTSRADSTRRILTAAGVDERRVRRIEGVADTDPFNPKDRTDPRNRRISVTLLYKDA